MNRPGFYIAAAAGLLLLSGTLAAGPESWPDRLDVGATAGDTRKLPPWHPPVAGWHSPGSVEPRLPKGHPRVPDLVVCPVTGATGKREAPTHSRTAAEGLVRI
jgi:hypothetical protein